jgi:hypothetical protein
VSTRASTFPRVSIYSLGEMGQLDLRSHPMRRYLASALLVWRLVRRHAPRIRDRSLFMQVRQTGKLSPGVGGARIRLLSPLAAPSDQWDIHFRLRGRDTGASRQMARHASTGPFTLTRLFRRRFVFMIPFDSIESQGRLSIRLRLQLTQETQHLK